MKELLALNKTFLRKSFLWISGIGSALFSVFLFFFFAEVATKWIFIVYGIPLFIISAWSSDWFRKRRYKRKILSNKPYAELATIGFTNEILKANHNSLVDYVRVAEINGFHIMFDVNLSAPKTASFTIYGTIQDLDRKQYVQKAMDYTYKSIDFSSGSFTRMIHTKKEQVQSIQQLEKILTEFTHIVKQERFEPVSLID